MEEELRPKAFISYSWSTPEHQQWVVDLANELGDTGVHVLLDKFDLREGNDANQFMERMVNDPEVTKVLLICDRVYAERTNSRKGGVGTEAQIISPKVYEAANQSKFVAVVKERDAEGKPYLPTYYGSRIYLDLSNQETYSQEFEKLQRWIFDKPMYERRPIGNPPAFLDEDRNEVSLGTIPAFRRAIDAVKGHKPNSIGAVSEYFDIFSTNLERLRIKRDDGKLWDDQVLENLKSASPARNEVLHLLDAIALYDFSKEMGDKVHRFFESLIPYFERPESFSGGYYETDFDNFRFLGRELFLYAVAIFLSKERFDLCETLFNKQYYFEGNRRNGGDVMVDYDAFNMTIGTLDERNKRLQTRYFSAVAILLKERIPGTGIAEGKLIQAEFVAYLRAEVNAIGTNKWIQWWPDMLVYAQSMRGALELFARAQSTAYFNRIKRVLGVEKPEDFTPVLQAIQQSQRAVRFDYRSVSIATLGGLEKLATRE
jgi:hypothetical protein